MEVDVEGNEKTSDILYNKKEGRSVLPFLLPILFFCVSTDVSTDARSITLRSCRSGSCRLLLRESGEGRARSLPSLEDRRGSTRSLLDFRAA